MGHKELLTDLIEELKTEELPFYERTAIRNWWFWHSAAGIVLVSTLGATVAASLMKATDSGGHGKVWLIVLPAIGTFSSAFIHLYRPKEKEALREEGRIEMQDIIRNARRLLASASTEAEYKEAFHQVRERARGNGSAAGPDRHWLEEYGIAPASSRS